MFGSCVVFEKPEKWTIYDSLVPGLCRTIECLISVLKRLNAVNLIRKIRPSLHRLDNVKPRQPTLCNKSLPHPPEVTAPFYYVMFGNARAKTVVEIKLQLTRAISLEIRYRYIWNMFIPSEILIRKKQRFCYLLIFGNVQKKSNLCPLTDLRIDHLLMAKLLYFSKLSHQRRQI